MKMITHWRGVISCLCLYRFTAVPLNKHDYGRKWPALMLYQRLWSAFGQFFILLVWWKWYGYVLIKRWARLIVRSFCSYFSNRSFKKVFFSDRYLVCLETVFVRNVNCCRLRLRSRQSELEKQLAFQNQLARVIKAQFSPLLIAWGTLLSFLFRDAY